MGKMLDKRAAAARFSAAAYDRIRGGIDAQCHRENRVRRDVMRHVITLEDGSTRKVARGVNIERVEAGAGEKVTVTTSKFERDRRSLFSITPTVD